MSWELFDPKKRKSYGPLDKATVLDLIRHGLDPKTLARPVGTEEWKSLRSHGPFAAELEGGGAAQREPSAPPPAAKEPRKTGRLVRIAICLVGGFVSLVALAQVGAFSPGRVGKIILGTLLLAAGVALAKRPRLRSELALGAYVGGVSDRGAVGFYLFLPLALVLAGLYFMVSPSCPRLRSAAWGFSADPGARSADSATRVRVSSARSTGFGVGVVGLGSARW
jgi:hypothetical protein